MKRAVSPARSTPRNIGRNGFGSISDARRGSYHLGDGIGLLGSQTSVLDRKGRGIPRREHAVQTVHPSECVGVDEPVAITRDATQSWSCEARLGDDAIDLETPIAGRTLSEPPGPGAA